MIKKLETKNAPAAIGPYSQGIYACGFLFISGQIPLNPENGEVVKGPVAVQTERVISNISAILKAADLDFSNVVKTTCFLTNIVDFEEFNTVYAKYFVNSPARSCIAVSALPKGVSVEIEVIALQKNKKALRQNKFD